MSDDTTNEGNSPEDNELIRKLRSDLKTANASIKTAGADAIALVERGTKAAGLMPEGFKGLADIFATEVDGDLDAASAAEWLKGRGFAASPDETPVEEATEASELEKVANLGAEVVASGNLTPTNTIDKQLEEVVTPGTYQSLDDVVQGVNRVLNG